MTQSLDQALAEIIADAEKLKSYRSDGAAYKKNATTWLDVFNVFLIIKLWTN